MCTTVPNTLYSKDGGRFKLEVQAINLTSSQFQKLESDIKLENADYWNTGKHFVELEMTEEQMIQIIDVKNRILNALGENGTNMKAVLESGKFTFTLHAFDRIDERIRQDMKDSAIKTNAMREKLNMDKINVEAYEYAASEEVQIELLELLLKGDLVDKSLRWYPSKNFRYKFYSTFHSHKISIVVTFGLKHTIITVITN